MERAGRSLAKLKLSDAVTHEDLARAAWPAAVGRNIARHAWVKALVRGNLVVEAEDGVWQQHLFHLRYQILPKLCDLLGAGIVREVEFRIASAAPRRPPQTAQSAHPVESTDEADRIQDPAFRMVYKQARKKASA
ncbi:MAG: DUF721 domain-containing protein [Acidobacteriia bacterium]|nr:DUF721 domain-containing protein [Terriglobia bacterium]